MSHAWRATGIFPYRHAGPYNPERERQVFVCDRCGYETRVHNQPGPDEAVWYRQSNIVDEISYFTCDEIVLLKVMDS